MSRSLAPCCAPAVAPARPLSYVLPSSDRMGDGAREPFSELKALADTSYGACLTSVLVVLLGGKTVRLAVTGRTGVVRPWRREVDSPVQRCQNVD